MTDTSDLEQQARKQATDLGRMAKGAVEEKLRKGAGVAAQVFDPGQRLRRLHLKKTVQEVSAFDCRNPLLFLGAAALGDSAAPRTLKATAPQNAAH
ncbi:hypothetical protein [Leisingera sp. McT4-56]|uniref:hypothetical protein n=1 Tax=Leisingera sp. McT4-56 TaxID=2881255 RepID=UPI001CF91DC2|nr:hypothetical protein [Leisingera sp. McT4-56]MCB4454138.1 hypothetical protein [Leisingera sp. McT4-56]